MWWLRRGLCRPCTAHQHRDPVIRNFAQGLALASQTTNLSFTVTIRDTQNHWYPCLPLVEPDTDRLLARSPNLYDSTRVTFDSSYDALFGGTDLHCQIRYVATHQYGQNASLCPATQEHQNLLQVEIPQYNERRMRLTLTASTSRINTWG